MALHDSACAGGALPRVRRVLALPAIQIRCKLSHQMGSAVAIMIAPIRGIQGLTRMHVPSRLRGCVCGEGGAGQASGRRQGW